MIVGLLALLFGGHILAVIGPTLHAQNIGFQVVVWVNGCLAVFIYDESRQAKANGPAHGDH